MDIKLHYCEKGAGDPLILLHGNNESSDYFINQIEYFSKLRRVIAVDTRGHGASPRGSAPFSIATFADDLANFLDELSIPSADILGFSDGGNIALAFALKYPQRVKKLVLNGANLNAKGVKRSVQFPIEIGFRIASFFAKFSPNAKRNAEMLGLMVNDPNIDPESLTKLQNDTLVIVGEKDMIKSSHTKLICEKLPHSELKIIPGDHFIANKNPTAFNLAVESFLN